MSLMRFLMKPVIILFLATMLTACESTVTTHGRLVEQADLNKLELGKTTQAEAWPSWASPALKGRSSQAGYITITRRWNKRLPGKHQQLIANLSYSPLIQTTLFNRL